MDEVDIEIQAELERRRIWITKWYGEKCDDYCSLCIICRIWKNFEEFEEDVK
jgi:hypothetical protein